MAVAPLTTTLTVRARGQADPSRVWRLYTVPAHWASWSVQIRAVETERPGDPVIPGTMGIVRGPGGVRVRFAVTSVDDAARRWTWQVQAGIVTLVLDHGVDDAGAGTQAWARITGPLPIVLGYAPLARHALHRLVSAESTA